MPNPEPGSQWERLSREAERFLATVYVQQSVNGSHIYRDSLLVQPRVSLFPGAGGSTAFFDPINLRIEVNPDLQTDLDPTFTSLLKQSTRLQAPVLSGALIHEVAHSLYSRFFHTADGLQGLTPWDKQLVTLWEESRVEGQILLLVAGNPAAYARTRTLLRASAAKVTNWDAPVDGDEPWTRGKAASAVSLVLARASVGILTDAEVAPLEANLRAGGLPEANIVRLLNVILQYRNAFHPYVAKEHIQRLIEEWRDAMSVLPAKQDDEGEDTGGCGGGATGQGGSTEPPVPTDEPGEPGQPIPNFHPDVEEEPEPDEDEEPDTEGGLPGAESDEEEPEEEPEGEDTNSEPEDTDEAPEGQDGDEPDEGEDTDLDEDEDEDDLDEDDDLDDEDGDLDEDDLDDEEEDEEEDEDDSDPGQGGGPHGQPGGVLDDISRKAQEEEAPRQAAEAAAEERIEARRAVAMKASRHRDMITKFKRTPEGGSVLQTSEE